MKLIVFVVLLSLTSYQSLFAQEKIEVYVNGVLKDHEKVSQIKVFNLADIIEFRIYCDQSELKLIADSIIGEGCGVKKVVKNKITIFPPSPQEQRSTTKTVDREFKTHFSKKPVYTKEYVSFTFSVNEVHACQGDDFSIRFSSGSKITKLNYKGYKSAYKFFLSI